MIYGEFSSLNLTLQGSGIPGEVITVNAGVGNISGAARYFWVTAEATGIGELPYEYPHYIGAGGGYTFRKTFSMPNQNCTVTVYAWQWDESVYDPETGFYGIWILDIIEVKTIAVSGDGGNPILTITNPSLKTVEILSFSFSGFQPNSRVHVAVSGGSSLTDVTANSSGAGSGSLTIHETAGGYNLFASDAYGHSAYALFTVTAQSGNWLPAFYSIVNSMQLSASIPQIAGWQAALSALVNSGQLVFTIPQVAGWMPVLYALANSGQLVFTIPQVAGWMPVLYALANSAQLTSTTPQSFGWTSALSALVNSAQLITSAPSSFGWFPAISALVNATLPLPKPPEEGKPNWTPWIIVGGAAVAGAALALANKDKLPTSVSKKTSKK